MKEEAFIVEEWPDLGNPVLIVGFEGWGNALDVSNRMAVYLVEKLEAKRFARVNPDPYYRYDENRPLVGIEDGILDDIVTPGGSLYAAR
ncbi:PAC2 family protein, partial [Thermodesulfobacteriota bacterium]